MKKILPIIIILTFLLGCNEKIAEPIIEQPKSPTLKLLEPNGNEIFTSGQNITISWESSNIKEFDIDISYDNGTTWHIIAERLDSLGKSFNYTPKDTCSYYCLIKIQDANDLNLSDTSDSTFTLIDINEAKKFYQLQEGNIWVYNRYDGYNNSFEKREIIGDTIINNDSDFKMRISTIPNYFKFYRISKQGNLVEYSGGREIVILDFTSPPGRYQINEAIVIERGDTSKTFFNEQLSVKWQYFQYGSGFGSETYDEFGKGLGQTSEHSGDLWSYVSYSLNGAVIDHVLYGDTSLSN